VGRVSSPSGSFGNIVPGAFTPVLAKHSKSFSLLDSISVGIDRMQRNFEPMRKQVEAWCSAELTTVAAKMIIYEAFIESELEAPKHLARNVHEHYFNPQYEEFYGRTIWSLSNVSLRLSKNLSQSHSSGRRQDWRAFSRDGWAAASNLGPYETPIREFLLGECRFPNGVALIVRIASSKVYTGGVMLPTCRPENGWHGHKFVIPGIDFTLHLGSRILEEIVRSSFAPSPRRFVMIAPEMDEVALEFAARKLQSARKQRRG
jgi:hypothetical protein